MKKALAVAVALAAASGAHAEWIPGTGGANTATSGELILTVWNTDNSKSYSQDLGISFVEMQSGAIAPNQSFALDAGLLSSIDSANANIRWNIAGQNQSAIALDSPRGSTATAENIGYYMTSNGDAADVGARNFANGTAQMSRIQIYSNMLTSQGGVTTGGAEPVWVYDQAVQGAYAGQAVYWGETQGGLAEYWGIDNATASLNESLDAWFVTFDLPGGAPQAYQDLGLAGLERQWTLDFANSTLGYSEVPVPAAAWLFLSALGGLGAVARRRKA